MNNTRVLRQNCDLLSYQAAKWYIHFDRSRVKLASCCAFCGFSLFVPLDSLALAAT
jgi:hypothetical protein